jgi:hypothetical protein
MGFDHPIISMRSLTIALLIWMTRPTSLRRRLGCQSPRMNLDLDSDHNLALDAPASDRMPDQKTP